MVVEVNWQAVLGILLILAGGGWAAWQWWQSRPKKTSPPQPKEADFQLLLNGLREAYASAIAANRKLTAELNAIRKVVGEPLPAPKTDEVSA